MRNFVTLAMMILALSICRGAQKQAFYVSPGGEDANPGTMDKPFATLERAREAVRSSKAAGEKTVILRGGTHYLKKTFILKQEDSGRTGSPVTYRAHPGEKPVVSGGMKLALKWQPHTLSLFSAKTPEGMTIDQLFVNGKRRHMARYPNYDKDASPYNGAAADAFSPERAANWANPIGGYIHAMHRAHWGGYHYRITGKNEKNEVTYEGGWQNNRQMGMHKNHRFVENIFEELDAPGEWYHNARTNTLYYYPDPGVDLATALFEVVILDHLVELQGSKENPVQDIMFSGITFRHTARTFMKTREPLLRSDWTIYRGGAILFNGARNCAIVDCEFDQPGGNAIFVNNRNSKIFVQGCHIHGAGASGICFVGNPKAVRNPLFEYHQRQSYGDIDKTPGPKSDDFPVDCLVDNCLIHNVSVVEKQATGVQVSMSRKITVSHCSIYDVGRAGINISEGTFGGHVIEYCDVFDTVRETGDHGSFNSWGRDRFWHLKDAPEDELPALALLDTEESVIRNSRWRCDRGWDIDLDDGSTKYHIYNNLCLNGGIKLREGFHRLCENNIMVNNSFHPHVWYKNSQDVFRNNIVFTKYRPIRVPTPWGKQCDLNLFHAPGMEGTAPAVALQKQSTLDKNSIKADAMFVDPAAGDYRVKEGSPALKLGFKNFPMDKFGVQSPKLKAIAQTPILPGQEVVQVAQTAAAPVYWQGALAKNLEGEAYSAFGVSKERGGVHLADVPAGCPAAEAGFKKGDLVQFINGKATKTAADLLRVTNQAEGKPLAIGYVRAQKAAKLAMAQYIHIASESTKSQFKRIALLPRNGLLPLKSISTHPNTHNEPVSVLSDGKVADHYGPVFGNGTRHGTYKVDLGEAREIREIRTFSFAMSGKRGSQRFTVFGMAGRNGKPVAIATVNVNAGRGDKYAASKICMAGGGNLGRFRWLRWVVEPVTKLEENTAFQEFQVR